LLATSSGDLEAVHQLADDAQEKGATNVSFLANFISGKPNECLDLLIKCNRLPEAAFFARTYVPSKVSEIVALWQNSIRDDNQKIADSIADPVKYDNLFEDYQPSLKAEAWVKENRSQMIPAVRYTSLPKDQTIFQEMEKNDDDEEFSSPPEIITEEDVKQAQPKNESEELDLEKEMEALGVDGDGEDINSEDLDDLDLSE